jgi:nicotinate-nucleotide adenylyltransferase
MIGILGGTFDPIHYGHLRTALDVQQALGLDSVRFIPLRDPPHRERPATRPEVRLAMVQAAVADQPLFQADDRELQRSGKSYTLDTLLSLRNELGMQPLCLLLGSDAFSGFPDWHRPERILELTHLVVMQRPGEQHPPLYRSRWCDDTARLRREPAGLIHFLPVTQLEISATRIRHLLQNGLRPRYLLPDPVLEIIQREGLYR